MANAIKKISARAKVIQRSHKTWTWKKCIKQASADYRAGKLGSGSVAGKKKKATRKKTTRRRTTRMRQTGRSNRKADSQRTARPPGARKPRGGKKVTYYEYRKNRSDMPGKMTGTTNSALNEMVLRNLRERNNNLIDGDNRLQRLKKAYASTPRGMARNLIKRQIADTKKYIKTIKQEISILKRNIK